MTELEKHLLDALARLKQHYNERDAALLERLRSLTARGNLDRAS